MQPSIHPSEILRSEATCMSKYFDYVQKMSHIANHATTASCRLPSRKLPLWWHLASRLLWYQTMMSCLTEMNLSHSRDCYVHIRATALEKILGSTCQSLSDLSSYPLHCTRFAHTEAVYSCTIAQNGCWTCPIFWWDAAGAGVWYRSFTELWIYLFEKVLRN